jgi:hypothetical protein
MKPCETLFFRNMMKNCLKIVKVVIMMLFAYTILISQSFHTLSTVGAITPLANESSESSHSFLFLKSIESESNSAPGSRGFNLYEGNLFKILYPSNWTKEDIPLVKYTAVESLPQVAFYVPDQNVEVIIATERPGKVLLPEYFSREVSGLQDSIAGYKFVGSNKTKLGNIPAQEILFVGDIVEEGLVYGQTKTMERICIFKGVSYFFIYRAEISEYSKYLPAVQEMIRSFVFKEA